MAGKEQYTPQQIAEALKQAKGMKTIAARNLGCDYKTIVRYIDKYATVKQALGESQEQLGDSIETTLLSEALGKRNRENTKWEREPNVTALIFLAKTHPVMRERGYSEKYSVTTRIEDWKSDAIKLIKEDKIDYETLKATVADFGESESLASELFKLAGVPIQTD